MPLPTNLPIHFHPVHFHPALRDMSMPSATNIVMSNVITKAAKYITGHSAAVNAIVPLEPEGYMVSAGAGM